ncbi:plexin-B2-like [Mercenaria mercenaria]|uniref:plexin-B2-like n=1 Tax=Mercenaria mercenaria TaxID=6596 RepID=UPI00234E66A0|nr:plexin-B2-like [Mercenaria mercenaria]
MAMSLLKLVFCVCCCVMSVRCLEQNKLVAWSSEEYSSLHSMLLTSDGEHLFIADERYVYYISPENLAFKRNVKCRTTQMIYDKTKNHLFLCCKGFPFCYQWLYGINDFGDYFKPTIRINGVKAFVATYAKPDDRKPNDNFLFIGCPHVEGQEKLGGKCTKPGIAWYLNHGNDKSVPWFGFKSFDKTPVLTDEFIDALTVDNLRLFFSKQTVKATGRRRSQIAQVCQHFIQRDNNYSTPYTYADMQVQCGQLKEIKAVKKVVVGTEKLFVIVFSDNSISAVCVFTMENVKRKFVENIKDCYRGIRVSEKEDYIDFQQSSIPCKTAIADNETFRKPDDYFLCNKDNLELYHHVIGTKILTSQPVLQYDVQLTAVTVSVVDSKVVAFFGTATRTILKAVVYPTASAVSIKQPVIRKVGHTILQDMYTSKDQKHIFVLTTKQVLKVPVESCRYFSSCEDCVTDPLCAWCVDIWYTEMR